MVEINDDFLYEGKKDSLTLNEKLEESLYYDQLLVLTAIASYNREEGIGKIRGKQAMVGEKDLDIHMHCLSYETALKGWQLLLERKISFESLCKQVHKVLMYGGKNMDYRVVPGELRKGTIFIGGETGEVDDSLFICPAPQELETGFRKIEKIIFQKLGEIGVDTKILGGYIHYLLTVLHPFQDGNGRLARIISITFLEYFGLKDARGFTFLAEMLEKENAHSISYYDTFGGEKEAALTERIKRKGTERVYDKNGNSAFIGNRELTFQDYIDMLDIENPAKNFARILNVVEEHRDIISIVVEIFLKAKSLSGDHILIWKFINRLFDSIKYNINTTGKSTITIDKNIINEVIFLLDGRLKKTSVKNLLILINHTKTKLSKVGIEVIINPDFFDEALKKGILGGDIITENIRKKFSIVI